MAKTSNRLDHVTSLNLVESRCVEKPPTTRESGDAQQTVWVCAHDTVNAFRFRFPFAWAAKTAWCAEGSRCVALRVSRTPHTTKVLNFLSATVSKWVSCVWESDCMACSEEFPLPNMLSLSIFTKFSLDDCWARNKSRGMTRRAESTVQGRNRKGGLRCARRSGSDTDSNVRSVVGRLLAATLRVREVPGCAQGQSEQTRRELQQYPSKGLWLDVFITIRNFVRRILRQSTKSEVWNIEEKYPIFHENTFVILQQFLEPMCPKLIFSTDKSKGIFSWTSWLASCCSSPSSFNPPTLSAKSRPTKNKEHNNNTLWLPWNVSAAAATRNRTDCLAQI